MPDGSQPTPPKRSLALLVFWFFSALVGFPLTFDCLSHIAEDSHRWDAVVPLNLAQPSDWAEAKLRTLSGGRFRVWLSTVGFDQTNEGRSFAGRIEAVVRDPSGAEKFTGTVGGNDGVPFVKTVNSGWAELGELEIPPAWLTPWILRARVVAADPDFSAMQPHLILRKIRPDLGMGGLIFYVFVYPGVILVLLSGVLSIVLFGRGRRWPLVVTLLISIPLWFLIFF